MVTMNIKVVVDIDGYFGTIIYNWNVTIRAHLVYLFYKMHSTMFIICLWHDVQKK